MSDPIKRVELLRQMYHARDSNSTTPVERELKLIKNELAVANDESARKDTIITNATGSPYLSDQVFQLKEVLYNSPDESSWKNVPSYEEARVPSAFQNLKRLNVL